jgi:phosphatidylethanolamine-binding protein (PEBP) family uncharacterized protein
MRLIIGFFIYRIYHDHVDVKEWRMPLSGACPPKGSGLHHYRFTIHALSIEKIELPANASSALAGYMINLHTIESSTIEYLYKRD